MNLFNTLLDDFVTRITAIGLAAIAAALLAYFRTQASAGIRWLLDPLARLLPWHIQMRHSAIQPPKLSSDLTIVDVFLLTPDGGTAIYQKTGDYVVNREPLSVYHEGVTASGSATGFSAERGDVIHTEIEHGFFISKIVVEPAIEVGTSFRNIYQATLLDSFTAKEEHWTQEIAVPTKRLILRFHFPIERPPTLIRCSRLVGLTTSRVRPGAEIGELFGQPSIIWEIEKPKLGDVYKLEWHW